MKEITEKYRPQRLEDVAGQITAIGQIQNVVSNRGYAGSTWWFEGPTGTGKTTIARIMANEFAGQEFTIFEFVGRDVSVDDIREYESRMALRPMGNGRVLIINEAQDLSDHAVSLLLALVEKIKASRFDMVIFTAMVDVLELKNDPMNRWRALIGRCCCPEFADTDSPVFRHEVIEFINGVAATEGIKGVDVEALCEKVGWSIRAALSALDMHERVADTESVPVADVVEKVARFFVNGIRLESEKFVAGQWSFGGVATCPLVKFIATKGSIPRNIDGIDARTDAKGRDSILFDSDSLHWANALRATRMTLRFCYKYNGKDWPNAVQDMKAIDSLIAKLKAESPVAEPAETSQECDTIKTGGRVLVRRRDKIVEVSVDRVGPKMFSDTENRWYWVKNVTKIIA